MSIGVDMTSPVALSTFLYGCHHGRRKIALPIFLPTVHTCPAAVQRGAGQVLLPRVGILGHQPLEVLLHGHTAGQAGSPAARVRLRKLIIANLARFFSQENYFDPDFVKFFYFENFQEKNMV